MSEDIFTTYYLERYVLGELPEELTQRIRKRATDDAAFRAKILALESSNFDILINYSPQKVKAAVSEKMTRNSAGIDIAGPPAESKSGRELHRFFSTRRIFAFSTAAVALLIFLFVVLPGLNEHVKIISPADIRVTDPVDVTLVKGGQAIDLTKEQLLIYRKKDNTVEMLENRQTALLGDLLQLAYVAGDSAHGIILSIDGSGVVSLHFPSKREGSTQLIRDQKVLLPNAIELDDAPDFERFFLITSGAPLNVSAILENAAHLAGSPGRMEKPLSLPEGVRQYSFLVLKGDSR